jgi:predicted secreted protein
MAQNGNNIIVYSGGTAIAGTRSSEVQSGSELIEVSSPTQGAWRQYIAGRKEWNVTVGFLVLSDSALAISNKTGIQDLLQVGNTFTLKIKERTAADSDGVTGTAILKTCKITMTRGNLVQGSFQFTGNGELSAPAAQA